MDIAAYAGTGDNWVICLSTGSNFTCSYGHGPGTDSKNVIAGDFNGDGKTDLAAYTGSNGIWAICLSADTTFNCGYGNGPGTTKDQIVAGDFNGDGKTDLAAYVGTGSTWAVCLSADTTFNCTYGNGPGVSAPNVIVGDFNGDGKTDLTAYTGSNGLWTMCLSANTTFNCSYVNGPGLTRDHIVTGDFTGDGKTDLAASLGTGVWQMCQFTGAGFDCKYWNGIALDAPYVITGDFNGDGRTDIAGWAGPTNGQLWYVCMADSNNFKCYSTASVAQLPTDMLVGDFNGDGVTDMAGLNSLATGIWDVRLAPVSSPDLMATTTSSLGIRTDVSYAPLSAPSAAGHYFRELTVKTPQSVATPALSVVLSTISDNAIGGRNTTNYWYGTALNSSDGRGFLGFNWVQSQLTAFPHIDRTYYAQTWPFTGAAMHIDKWYYPIPLIGGGDYVGNWQILSATYNNYQANKLGSLNTAAPTQTTCAFQTAPYPFVITLADGTTKLPSGSPAPCNGPVQIYTYQTDSYGWDLDGTALPGSQTATTVDGFGSPLQITTQNLNSAHAAVGYTKTIINEYINDPTNWWIGRLKKSSVTSNKPAN